MAIQMTDTPVKHKLNPMLKLALDIGPLILFFIANWRPGLVISLLSPLLPDAMTSKQAGILAATAVFMVAVVLALIVAYVLTRRLPMMPVVTAVIVLIFGALTIYFENPTFIQMKPTIVYTLLGLALIGGWLFDKPLLAIVFDAMFHLTEEGWRKLTLRWAAFFFAMAVVNEIVRLNWSFDFWLGFKGFGFIPLTFVFAMLQYPLLMRYASEQPNPEAEAEREEVS
jgi:intracellular septation protein